MTAGDHHPGEDRLLSRLSTLRTQLEEERSLPSSARPTGASEESLQAAIRHVEAVTSLWAEGRRSEAWEGMERVAFMVVDTWSHQSDLSRSLLSCKHDIERLLQRESDRDQPLSRLDVPPARAAIDLRRAWVFDLAVSLRAERDAWLAAVGDGRLTDDRAWTLLAWVQDAASLVVSEKRPELVEAAGFALALLESDALGIDRRDVWVVAELLRLACDISEISYRTLIEQGTRRAGELGDKALPGLQNRQGRLPTAFFEEVWDDGPFVFRRKGVGRDARVIVDDPWAADVDLSAAHETNLSLRGAVAFFGIALVGTVVVVGVVTWLNARGWLSVAGIFVVPVVVPLVFSLVLLGLAFRSHRLAARTIRDLRPLRAGIRQELVGAGAARPTGASDRELERADGLIARALANLTDQRPAAGALLASHLARLVAEHWASDAPLTRRVVAAGRSASRLARVHRRVDRSHSAMTERGVREDPSTVPWWDRWLIRVPVFSAIVWLLAIGLVADDDGMFRDLPMWTVIALGLTGTGLIVWWQLREERRS